MQRESLLAKNREKSVGKGVDERESGGGVLKEWEGSSFWMRISSWTLGWGRSHLPHILALDFDMWPLSPLSLALVPTF